MSNRISVSYYFHFIRLGGTLKSRYGRNTSVAVLGKDIEYTGKRLHSNDDVSVGIAPTIQVWHFEKDITKLCLGLRMSYRRQKRWWNAYILFYERLDIADRSRKMDVDRSKGHFYLL